MVNQRNRIRSFAVLLGDLAATALAFFCAYAFRDAFQEIYKVVLFPLSWYLNLLWFFLPLVLLVFFLFGHYQYWRGPGIGKEAWKVFQAVTLSSLLLGFFVFILKFQFVSRIFIASQAAFTFLFVLLFRILARRAVLFLTHHREDFRMILIVGLGQEARDLARRIEEHKDLGLRVLGFLSPRESGDPSAVSGPAVLGPASDLPLILDREVVDEVIFALSQEELKRAEPLLLLCEERGVTSRVILNFFPHVISRTYLEELDGFPLLTFSTTPKNEMMLFARRIFDFAGSLVWIVLLSPLFLLVWVLIRLDSPGAALYRQVRCGMNGRKFTFYKFRSMKVGAEKAKKELMHLNEMSGPVFKIKNDPRVTRVGRFLRKTSLDELPQLFNVLRGDMSFVGPRPLPAEEVEKIKGWQRRRLSMKPGITGLWQVSGRNQVDFHDWVKLDLEYIDNWSLWLDLKILLKTIPAVLSGKGAM